MSDTKRTTPAPSCATPSIETSARRKPARKRVDHLFWVERARVARELGVDFQAICGRWISPPSQIDIDEPDVVKPIIVSNAADNASAIVADTQPRECRNCKRSLEAYWRRLIVERLRGRQ